MLLFYENDKTVFFFDFRLIGNFQIFGFRLIGNFRKKFPILDGIPCPIITVNFTVLSFS